MDDTIIFPDFAEVKRVLDNLRVGVIIEVLPHPDPKATRSYAVKIDFGAEIGVKTSSMQARREYPPEELVGMQVVGLIGLAPREVRGVTSEVLLVGVQTDDPDKPLSLLTPSRPAKIGSSAY